MENDQQINLEQYDKILVQFSGGKDSLACLLHLIDMGVPTDKIELWHQSVDGDPTIRQQFFMDWPVTTGYCQAISEYFRIPLFHQWKEGGFKGELLRENERTKPTMFETLESFEQIGGERGKLSTRRKFPALSADLSTRWCSAYLKIDVAKKAIINQSRFDDSKTLVVTGERAQESAARAKYKSFEVHRADNRTGKKKRHVDQWRPVLKWDEKEVWAIIEKYGINPHPAYHLGFGRVSCMTCVFASCNQWASIKQIAPERFEEISQLERDFNHTIQKGISIENLASRGKPYPMEKHHIELALDEMYPVEIVYCDDWTLPKGAFGESAGPV